RFSGKWSSATGLVLGSMTPDFEYFLRMKIQGHYSHTLPGIFFFDLPVGLFLAFVFHNAVRDSLFDNLPAFLSRRLTVFKSFNWNQYFAERWPVVIVSIIIGAASHLFWDGFTHRDGYFVILFPSLKHVVNIFGVGFPVCRILQHLSTLAGGAAIAWVLSALPSDPHPKTQVNSRYWLIVAALTLLIATVRILSGLHPLQLGNITVTGIAAFFISISLTPALTRRFEKA
ncbi:MAG TPA: DUF4184 family protein, partial [Chryseosolibacter sp.]